MINFYLVQRLTPHRPTRDVSRGFDAYFQLEYMGSSEFEWGAIPVALKKMRTKTVGVEPRTVDLQGREREVFFVGHPGVGDTAAEAMADWSKGNGRRPPFWGKEWTYFDEIAKGRDIQNVGTEAWWDIVAGVSWALTKDVADMLVAAFNSRPSAP